MGRGRRVLLRGRPFLRRGLLALWMLNWCGPLLLDWMLRRRGLMLGSRLCVGSCRTLSFGCRLSMLLRSLTFRRRLWALLLCRLALRLRRMLYRCRALLLHRLRHGLLLAGCGLRLTLRRFGPYGAC